MRSYLQFCLGLFLLRHRSSFHHGPCFARRFREVVLQFSGVSLQTCDRPANVIISDRVGQTVAIGDN